MKITDEGVVLTVREAQAALYALASVFDGDIEDARKRAQSRIVFEDAKLYVALHNWASKPK